MKEIEFRGKDLPQELRVMFSDSDWNNVLIQLQTHEKQGNVLYYAMYASAMRKFDQDRFDQDHKVTDPMRFLLGSCLDNSLKTVRIGCNDKTNNNIQNS